MGAGLPSTGKSYVYQEQVDRLLQILFIHRIQRDHQEAEEQGLNFESTDRAKLRAKTVKVVHVPDGVNV